MSTFALHHDHDQKKDMNVPREMCEDVIDKILVDPELTQQIIIYDLDAVELVKRRERNAIQRPYNQIFRNYIKGVCGKDRVGDEEPRSFV